MKKNFYSLYSSGWNLIDNLFDYEFHINNFCEFIGDSGGVTICCNTSSDNSLETLQNLTKKYSNLKIIESDFSYENPDLDGLVKNASLQSTTNPIKISADMDEAFELNQKVLFDELAESLLKTNYQSIMIPTINLLKDKKHYKDLGQKWRIHKSGLFRGTVNFAKNPDGTHKTNLSDSCELISNTGDLVSSAYLLDPSLPDEQKLEKIKKENIPFVWHYGLLDLEKKAARNRNFWSKMWSVEAGHEVKVELSAEEFEKKFDSVAKLHGLTI